MLIINSMPAFYNNFKLNFVHVQARRECCELNKNVKENKSVDVPYNNVIGLLYAKLQTKVIEATSRRNKIFPII